jgi:hypothetical protein
VQGAGFAVAGSSALRTYCAATRSNASARCSAKSVAQCCCTVMLVTLGAVTKPLVYGETNSSYFVAMFVY